MDISLFRRGIRLSRRPSFGPVKELSPPKRVILLPGYGFKKPYKQLVKVKDIVGPQDPVAQTEDGNAVCTPIGGEVTSIDNVLCVDGRRVPGITVTAATEAESRPIDARIGDEKIQTLVRQAGITQTAFGPRHLCELVDEAKKGKTKYLAIRFSDQDPYVGSLQSVTSELADDISNLETGVDLIKEMLGDVGVHFVFEAKQSAPQIDRFAADHKIAAHRVDGFDYPKMSDALIASRIIGNDSAIDPSAVHTSDVFVLDIDTVLNVANAARRKWVTEKIITICGEGIASAVRVKIGTCIGEILRAAGVGSDFANIILGGPLTGYSCHDLDYPLTPDINGITLQTQENATVQANHQCISCGLCTMVCPMRLVPGMLSRYCEYDDWEKAQASHIFNCIECGCCAYVCPAERSMVQLFSHGKKEIRAGKES